MLTIQKMISDYNFSSRQGSDIEYLIFHYTGNKGDTALNNAKYFNACNRNASAHFFVDDENIYQVVNLNNSAWAVGDGKGAYGILNRNSVSIEMCCNSEGFISETTEANALELGKYLMDLYGIDLDHVVRHYDASRKICPNWTNNNWERWLNFKSKLAGTTVKNEIVETTVVAEKDPIAEAKTYVGIRVLELQQKLIACGYDCGGHGADGIFGKGTYESLIQFQKDNGLKIDGLAGPNTFDKLYELVAVNDSDISFNFEKWVKDLQTECNRQGFSKQKVDGDPGDKTLKGCPTLRKGAEGNITKLAQERLISLGYDLGKHGADGDFETATYSAVIKFQKDYGLSTDGIVGQNTWRKLLNL
ncbi:N-acetylmuramoyl-L-alanine amidase [uncultured Clostridium sp.]|jgi:peptidoglycan hydrolase-like protein with peptidoglycan-binding domain|uniref:peptidoglycan recognition protein family protein n=1 Tax=Clostridium sp. TaxID=1506 RepID=UPI002670815E|nr:N-acetylmuramoyl-L-alanine amidase [uncultured Clostridium sp.]